jgi:hypothetical protein
MTKVKPEKYSPPAKIAFVPTEAAAMPQRATARVCEILGECLKPGERAVIFGPKAASAQHAGRTHW